MRDDGKKISAIIQARMTSSRLPGKVLKEVNGKPLFSYMLERVLDSKYISKIIVATTTNSDDDPIAKLAVDSGVFVYRGSELNVLERFYKAAKKYHAEDIMRLTADCPLIDPELLDDLVTFYSQGQYDYASNCLEPTLPDGLDAEIFTFQALNEAFQKAVLPSHIEHVTLYIRENPEKYKIGSWKYKQDFSGHRWTVDQVEDFIVVEHIIKKLYGEKKKFRLNDIIRLVSQHPEIEKVNSLIVRNEGLIKSKKDDGRWLIYQSKFCKKR